MSYPYAFVNVLEGKGNPNLELPKELDGPKEEAEFLQKDENMKGYYLGACLDSCRWGSQMTVMWEMSIKEMVGFIQNWRKQNKENYQELFHERGVDELYNRFELPHINHDICPRAKENKKEHEGIVEDLAGRVRCAHKSIRFLKPNYIVEYNLFDQHSKMNKLNIYERKPSEPSYFLDDNGEIIDDPDTEREFEEYEMEMEEFNNEKRTLEVLDICYSILSDRDVILPLEEVLRRVNIRPELITTYCNNNRFGPCDRVDELSSIDKELYEIMGDCPGHLKYNNKFETPFDGWDLAFYVQKWSEQVPDGKAPLFGKV